MAGLAASDCIEFFSVIIHPEGEACVI